MKKKRKGWIQSSEGDWYQKGKKEDLQEPIRGSLAVARLEREYRRRHNLPYEEDVRKRVFEELCEWSKETKKDDDES